MRKYSIALMKGDGIGPEVSQAALAVLDAQLELPGVNGMPRLESSRRQ